MVGRIGVHQWWEQRCRERNKGLKTTWAGQTSLTWWTGVWASSGSCWRTGKPGVLQSMGLQRVGHDWVTELNWIELVKPFMKWTGLNSLDWFFLVKGLAFRLSQLRFKSCLAPFIRCLNSSKLLTLCASVSPCGKRKILLLLSGWNWRCWRQQLVTWKSLWCCYYCKCFYSLWLLRW